MRPVMLLARLNDIDLDLDAMKARLGEIAEALKEPRELQQARTAAQEADADLAHWRAIQQEREAAQKRAADRLAKAEANLYSGKVRDSKELQDAERDVNQLRRQRSQAEDDWLEALIALDSATETAGQRQSELSKLAVEWQARQTRLRAEQARVRQRLLNEQARAAAARGAVPADLLGLYDGLRPRRGGRAVASLDEEMCSACHVDVPPVKLETARFGEELVYCSNCGRLLWGE